MRDVFVLGSFTTPFRRAPEKTHHDLTREALEGVLADAGIEASRIDATYFGSAALHVFGQPNIGGQVLLYGVFALVVGLFSHWPPYHPLAADQALVKLSFTHSAKHVSECRQLSKEELARLPPNMRAPTQCDRALASSSEIARCCATYAVMLPLICGNKAGLA